MESKQYQKLKDAFLAMGLSESMAEAAARGRREYKYELKTVVKPRVSVRNGERSLRELKDALLAMGLSEEMAETAVRGRDGGNDAFLESIGLSETNGGGDQQQKTGQEAKFGVSSPVGEGPVKINLVEMSGKIIRMFDLQEVTPLVRRKA